MITYGMNNNEALMKRTTFPTAFFRNILLAFVAVCLLTSCSNFRQGSFNSGLLEIGRQQSHFNCRNQMNERDYQACINQVDENYDAYTK